VTAGLLVSLQAHAHAMATATESLTDAQCRQILKPNIVLWQVSPEGHSALVAQSCGFWKPPVHAGAHCESMVMPVNCPQQTSLLGQSAALEQLSEAPVHAVGAVHASFSVIPLNVTQHTSVSESHVVVPH